jgi:sugar lactone lactonase YvrE
VLARGLHDPNAIAVLPDGDLLVSDAFAIPIRRVRQDGAMSTFSESVPHANGMVLSRDRSVLYIAQTFDPSSAPPRPGRPTRLGTRVMAIALDSAFRAVGDPWVVFRTPRPSGPDGLALDPQGRLHLATTVGELWRIDPSLGTGTVVATGLPGLASLAFGRGAFGTGVLYATQLAGGRLLRITLDQP